MIDLAGNFSHDSHMSVFGEEVVAAGEAYLGSKFRNHFKPEDLCRHGTITLDSCMERGLGQNGEFDCSGLVIASISRALGAKTHEWPKEYRHSLQLATLIEDWYPSDVGDVAAFYLKGYPGVHLGILAAKMTVIHASGRTQNVEKGAVKGEIYKTRIIPLDKLLELGLETQMNSRNENHPTDAE